MKREVIFVLVLVLFLMSLYPVYADEASQVEDAYTCLSSTVSQKGCSALSFDEKVFSNLASELCTQELLADSYNSNQCWPKSGCKLKSTSQAILALEDEIDTEKAETWLLQQTSTPQNIDWFLEIEILGAPSSQCIISYSGSSYPITINEDKTISTNAGPRLTRATAYGNYWLKIDHTLYNQETIRITCNHEFISTLLFMKQGTSTIHVSDTVHHSYPGTDEIAGTREIVHSLCFAQDGVCNYEGSLWGAFTLYLTEHSDYEYFLPYLLTLKDESVNKPFIPEAFLYFLTGKFETDLLLRQKYSSYWEESGYGKYYDTALALLPFGSNSPQEEKNSKTWLLSVQQNSGCWNNNNIRDTAFVLYSLWPKSGGLVSGICETRYDCPQVDCQEVSCTSNKCVYESVGCQNYDGCCLREEGCTANNDNDCEDIECDADSDCRNLDATSDPYCYDDKTLYRDVYTYSCNLNRGECTPNVVEEKVGSCSGSDVCKNGECITEGGVTTQCGWLRPCPTGEKCEGGYCVLDIICTSDSQCGDSEYSSEYCMDESNVYRDLYTYTCDLSTPAGECSADVIEEFVQECTGLQVCEDGECIQDGCAAGVEECSWWNKCEEGYTCDDYGCCFKEPDCLIDDDCNDGYICVNEYCVSEGECGEDNPCPPQECKEATCESGTCLYRNNCYIECEIDEECTYLNSQSLNYCDGSGDVYMEFYNFTCEDNFCDEVITENLIEDCGGKECYAGECIGEPGEGCASDLDCSFWEVCNLETGECYEEEDPCESDSDCNYGTCDLTTGNCIPYECDWDGDCPYGTCIDGECISLDCLDEGYTCDSPEVCESDGGIVMEGYFCNSDIHKCCDVEVVLNTCEFEEGIICEYGEECLNGVKKSVSDNLGYGEVCCVGGTCGKLETPFCVDKKGTCKSSCDEKTEDEKSYLCDSSSESCCVPKTTTDNPKPRGWILIVILLLLIAFAALGIVFRDKLRTQWIKIKDKMSGKKEKKKFEMPLTMHSNPQGRILPRRILPPGAHPQIPIQSRYPVRPGQPGQPMQGQTPSQAQKPSQPSQQSPQKPLQPSPQKSSQQTPPSSGKETSPVKTPSSASQPTKKPLDKPKGTELDDVLKKLKDMGNK